MESQNPALEIDRVGRKKSADENGGDEASAINQIHLSAGNFAIPPDPSDDDDPRAVIASEGIQDVWEGVAPMPGDVALDTVTANVVPQLVLPPLYPPLYPAVIQPIAPVMRSVDAKQLNHTEDPIEAAEREALLKDENPDAASFTVEKTSCVPVSEQACFSSEVVASPRAASVTSPTDLGDESTIAPEDFANFVNIAAASHVAEQHDPAVDKVAEPTVELEDGSENYVIPTEHEESDSRDFAAEGVVAKVSAWLHRRKNQLADRRRAAQMLLEAEYLRVKTEAADKNGDAASFTKQQNSPTPGGTVEKTSVFAPAAVFSPWVVASDVTPAQPDVATPVVDESDFAKPASSQTRSSTRSPFPAEPKTTPPESEVVNTPDPDPVENDLIPATPERGGWIVAMVCFGIAIISVCVLMPLAEENHQLAWQREKLKTDLLQIRDQVHVNDEFLKNLSKDPTLAERLAQRQVKLIRKGMDVLDLPGTQSNVSTGPFQLITLPPPNLIPAYQPLGGAFGAVVRNSHTRIYLSGVGLLLLAAGLILGGENRPREIQKPV